MTNDTSTETAPAAPKYHPCTCQMGTSNQCSGQTLKAFARGHDARMASRVAQEMADGKMTTDQAEKLIRRAGGGDLLVGKTMRSARLRQEAKTNPKTPRTPKAAKAPRTQTESAADKAVDGATTTGQVTGKEVGVSHGARKFKAVVVRTAANDLMARHRFQGKDCDHELEV
jgi:hypothetical protein